MKVRVVEEAVDQLIEWSAEAASLKLETGGVLLGMFADGDPWITTVTHVDNAERTGSRFELPAGVTQDIVRQARARDDRVGYLGDWHSHPADVGPSSTDLGSLRQIAARAIGVGDRPPIIVVVRRGKSGWRLDGRVALRWPFGTRPVDLVVTGPPASAATSQERIGAQHKTEGSPQQGGLRRLRLRYPGTCVRCGTALAAGTDALYDGAQKSVRCVSCPTENSSDAATFDPGVAGTSARREYERRVARREARVRDRFGRRLGGVILALSDDPQSTRAWARGSEGEEELASALAGVEGIRVLHDRRVPGTRGNIDHIVVAPGGIFVVDAKRYEGTIRVRDVGGPFRRDERLYVGRRDCSRLAENMKWQVEAVERILASLQWTPPPVTPVLCFVHGEWPLLFPPDSYREVRLAGTRSIKKLVLKDLRLDDDEISEVAGLLSRHLPPK